MRKRLFSIAYMFLLTLVFTSIVSGVKVFNEERIETNQRVRLQRVVIDVLGLSRDRAPTDREVIETFENRIKVLDANGRTLYVGYGPDGRAITGYAFPVGGPGFWGPVQGMMAVDPGATRVLGLAFYRHSETPGLGGRITEAWFTRQFAGLRLLPLEGRDRIFLLRPPGPGKAPGELDAITGATGTSRAVEAFLNRDLQRFLKDFRKSFGKG